MTAAAVRTDRPSFGATGAFRFLSAEHPLPWLLPLIALLVVFGVIPFAYNVWLSFHEYNAIGRRLVYVGLANWQRLFTEERTRDAILLTMLYTAICLAVELVLGLAIALLLDADIPGFAVLRGLMTLPLVIPPAIVGLMFLLMEDGQFGVVSNLLYDLGIVPPTEPLLSTPSTALAGVLIADIWQWTPFMVLIFLAGLRALPREPFEAAMIDGASWLQSFRRLTLPMLGRVMAVAILIRGIDLFRIFDYVFVMTAGGPGTTTETVSYYTWQQTFNFIKWGYGATLSLFILIVLTLVANLFIRVAKVRF